jgi:hypothetical protein
MIDAVKSSAMGTAPDGFGGQAQRPLASAPFAPVARGDILEGRSPRIQLMRRYQKVTRQGPPSSTYPRDIVASDPLIPSSRAIQLKFCARWRLIVPQPRKKSPAATAIIVRGGRRCSIPET